MTAAAKESPKDKLEALEQSKAPRGQKDPNHYVTVLNTGSPLRGKSKDWNVWCAKFAEFLSDIEGSQVSAAISLYAEELKFVKENRAADYEAIMALVPKED